MGDSRKFEGSLDLIGRPDQFTAKHVVLRKGQGEIGFAFEWMFEGERATIEGSAVWQSEASCYRSIPIAYDSNHWKRPNGYRAIISVFKASVESDGSCNIEGSYTEANGNPETDGTWRFEGTLDPVR